MDISSLAVGLKLDGCKIVDVLSNCTARGRVHAGDVIEEVGGVPCTDGNDVQVLLSGSCNSIVKVRLKAKDVLLQRFQCLSSTTSSSANGHCTGDYMKDTMQSIENLRGITKEISSSLSHDSEENKRFHTESRAQECGCSASMDNRKILMTQDISHLEVQNSLLLQRITEQTEEIAQLRRTLQSVQAQREMQTSIREELEAEIKQQRMCWDKEMETSKRMLQHAHKAAFESQIALADSNNKYSNVVRENTQVKLENAAHLRSIQLLNVKIKRLESALGEDNKNNVNSTAANIPDINNVKLWQSWVGSFYNLVNTLEDTAIHHSREYQALTKELRQTRRDFDELQQENDALKKKRQVKEEEWLCENADLKRDVKVLGEKELVTHQRICNALCEMHAVGTSLLTLQQLVQRHELLLSTASNSNNDISSQQLQETKEKLTCSLSELEESRQTILHLEAREKQLLEECQKHERHVQDLSNQCLQIEAALHKHEIDADTEIQKLTERIASERRFAAKCEREAIIAREQLGNVRDSESISIEALKVELSQKMFHDREALTTRYVRLQERIEELEQVAGNAGRLLERSSSDILLLEKQLQASREACSSKDNEIVMMKERMQVLLAELEVLEHNNTELQAACENIHRKCIAEMDKSTLLKNACGSLSDTRKQEIANFNSLKMLSNQQLKQIERLSANLAQLQSKNEKLEEIVSTLPQQQPLKKNNQVQTQVPRRDMQTQALEIQQVIKKNGETQTLENTGTGTNDQVCQALLLDLNASHEKVLQLEAQIAIQQELSVQHEEETNMALRGCRVRCEHLERQSDFLRQELSAQSQLKLKLAEQTQCIATLEAKVLTQNEKIENLLKHVSEMKEEAAKENRKVVELESQLSCFQEEKAKMIDRRNKLAEETSRLEMERLLLEESRFQLIEEKKMLAGDKIRLDRQREIMEDEKNWLTQQRNK